MTRYIAKPGFVSRVTSVVLGASLYPTFLLVGLAFLLAVPMEVSANAPTNDDAQSETKACSLVADARLEEPIRAILAEFERRGQIEVSARFLPVDRVNELLQSGLADCDVIVCMASDTSHDGPVAALDEAKKVAWKYPSGEPVWAAAIGDHPGAANLCAFLGDATGHRLWSESKAGFTITSGKTHAEAFEWVAEHRTKLTYPLTAARMLRECGARDGICIDVGCGPGNLDLELAKRSNLTIIGLDIDGDMKPLFDENVRKAGFQDRVRFVEGDAQQMPFPDDYADVIVSRGTLVFIPDIAKCLREVARVLKPTGTAFLGGRYIYTPQVHKISTEKLRQIVAESGVPGAQVIETRGQWVKIVGPKTPPEAGRPQTGPHLLANRILADYRITKGNCLLICGNDGEHQQSLQQGFLDLTELRITAMYPSQEVADEAGKRIREAGLADRIGCRVGELDSLPFDASCFDLVAATGPVLIWGDREKKIGEIHRVLRPGGAALVGGRYLGMPDFRKVSSDTLRAAAANTGIKSVRVIDEMGQWVEIRK